MAHVNINGQCGIIGTLAPHRSAVALGATQRGPGRGGPPFPSSLDQNNVTTNPFTGADHMVLEIVQAPQQFRPVNETRTMLDRSWTWVYFARSNPAQSSNLMTQSNPIHDNSVYSDPHPI